MGLVALALALAPRAHGFSNLWSVILRPGGMSTGSVCGLRGLVGHSLSARTMPARAGRLMPRAAAVEGDFDRIERIRFDGENVIYTEEVDGNDVGAMQAATPLSPQNPYFEVTMVDGGTNSWLGVGIADKGYDLDKQPGWNPNSVGYHADDGAMYKCPRMEDQTQK